MQQAAGHWYHSKRTITHLLLKYRPRFLMLDAKWVDALLKAEADMKDDAGKCSLVHLFMSEKLDGFDFGCRRFRELLQWQHD